MAINFKHSILALTLAGSSFGTQAETLVEDFENKPALAVYEGEKRGGDFILENAPEARGISGKATWKDKRFNYNEYRFKKFIPLPEFDDKLDGTVSVWVYGGPGNRAEKKMSVRLIDSKGEVFQYKSPINSSLKPGWQKLTYRITSDNANCSWGNKSDKKFDLPARLLGFAINYNSKVQGAGSIYIDDITHKATTKSKIDVKKVLWNFDRTEKWQAYGLKKEDSFKKQNGKWTLSLNSGIKAVHMFCRKDRLVKAGNITELMMRLKALSGNAKLTVRFKNDNNKWGHLKALNIKKQNGQLTWKLPNDFARQSKKIPGPYHIDNIRIDRLDINQPLVLQFDSGIMIERIAPAKAISVDIDTGNPIHILKTGEVNKVVLKLRNNATETLSFRIEVSMENYFHQTINFSNSFVMSPQSDKIWKSPALPRKLGIWWVNYRIIAEGNEHTGRRSFAYMTPAGPTPGLSKGFIFGMCTHTERWSERDQELEVMATAMCGAKVVRAGLTWGSLEKEQGQWNFDLQDRLVDLYEKNNIEFQAIFGFTPKWAAPPETHNTGKWTDWSRAVPNMEAWKNYVRTMTTRYGDRIRYWEVWNEPDLSGFYRGTRVDYLAMMKAAYQEAKAVNPNIQILTGGFATLNHHPGKKDPDFHKVVVKDGEGFYDIHAFHQHGSFDSFQKSIDGKMADIRSTLKDPKPLYFNETAIHSLGDSQRNQAEVLVKKFLFSMARGAIGYNWYDLRDDGFDDKDGEHNFGLVTNDFYPKAAYPAYNTLALLFKGKEFVKQLNLGPNRWVFVFEGNDEQIIVAWNEATGDAGEHIALKTDAASASYIDIMGNSEIAAIDNQMVVLPITPIPSYLALKKATSPPAVKGNLIGLASQATVVAGIPTELSLQLFNPFSKSASFEMNLYTPQGVKTNWISNKLTVNSGQQKQLPLTLTVDAETAAAMGGKLMLKVLYRVAGSPWFGMVPVPLNLARLIKPEIAEDIDFVVNQRENVFNICENDPANWHLTWQGPKDLSTNVSLGQKENAMLIRVKVNDDIHSQKFSGGNIWKGDSVQIALQIPGQVGRWEIGVARLADGKPAVFCWDKPTSFSDPSANVKLTSEKVSDGVIYNIELPYKTFGLSDAILKKGIKFNMAVNDNDGDLREGWIQIAPGIAGRKDTKPYPFVVFDID